MKEVCAKNENIDGYYKIHYMFGKAAGRENLNRNMFRQQNLKRIKDWYKKIQCAYDNKYSEDRSQSGLWVNCYQM